MTTYKSSYPNSTRTLELDLDIDGKASFRVRAPDVRMSIAPDVNLSPADARALADELTAAFPAPRYEVRPPNSYEPWRVVDTKGDLKPITARFTHHHPNPEAAAQAEADRLNGETR